MKEVVYAKRWPVAYLPLEHGWQLLDAYTRLILKSRVRCRSRGACLARRGTPSDVAKLAYVAGRAPFPVGTNAGLYVSLIAEGRYDEALQHRMDMIQAHPGSEAFPNFSGSGILSVIPLVCLLQDIDEHILL